LNLELTAEDYRRKKPAPSTGITDLDVLSLRSGPVRTAIPGCKLEHRAVFFDQPSSAPEYLSCRCILRTDPHASGTLRNREGSATSRAALCGNVSDSRKVL